MKDCELPVVGQHVPDGTVLVVGPGTVADEHATAELRVATILFGRACHAVASSMVIQPGAANPNGFTPGVTLNAGTGEITVVGNTGALNDLTGLWSSCFMLLFVIVVASLVWMDVAVRRMQRREGTNRT